MIPPRAVLLLSLICLLVIASISAMRTKIVIRRKHRVRATDRNRNPSIHGDKNSSRDSVVDDADVIICVVLRHEDAYVDEWIQYHHYLGFDYIHIYDNSQNGSAKIGYLPQKYGDFVRVQFMPGDGIQDQAYNDCAMQHRVGRVWAAFIDCDEFIVLRKHASIHDLLADTVPHGGSLALNRIAFGSNGHLLYRDLPVLQRFTARKNGIDEFVKSISYLPDVLQVLPHFPVLSQGKKRLDCHGHEVSSGSVWHHGSEDVAAINHYFTKSLEEFRHKRRRGYAHSAHLNAKYHTREGERLILLEFEKADNRSNVVFDTSARDYFHLKQQKK